MALDWTQITLLVGTFGTSLGAAIGLPIANALRRPGIEKAIEKSAAVNALPLVAKDEDQQREIAALRSEFEKYSAAATLEQAFAKQRIAFLELAILKWEERKEPAPPAVTP